MAYRISCAYAYSPDAIELKKPDGCYVLESDGIKQAFDSYADACLLATGEPSRFSMDHPLNAKYLPKFGAGK